MKFILRLPILLFVILITVNYVHACGIHHDSDVQYTPEVTISEQSSVDNFSSSLELENHYCEESCLAYHPPCKVEICCSSTPNIPTRSSQLTVKESSQFFFYIKSISTANTVSTPKVFEYKTSQSRNTFPKFILFESILV